MYIYIYFLFGYATKDPIMSAHDKFRRLMHLGKPTMPECKKGTISFGGRAAPSERRRASSHSQPWPPGPRRHWPGPRRPPPGPQRPPPGPRWPERLAPGKAPITHRAHTTHKREHTHAHKRAPTILALLRVLILGAGPPRLLFLLLLLLLQRRRIGA